MNRALPVAADDLLDATALQDAGHGNSRGPDAGYDHANVFEALADNLERVDERGEDHYCGAVLIVVEDRYVETGSQPLLDLEASRCRDVLEIDSAESRSDGFDRRDD